MNNSDIIEKLGPLAPLAGHWKGDEGIDISPSKNGAVTTKYRELITFDPLGPVTNGPQILYGLKYTTTIWPLDEEEPFHEEVGYWLWDAKAQQVMRCFIVPRGIAINAGGTAAENSKEFSLRADIGSETYGVMSNPFLDKAFKTVCYTLKVTINNDGSFSYEEDTQLDMPRLDDIFHHTDQNRLVKC